jgi:hypothetical protein
MKILKEDLNLLLDEYNSYIQNANEFDYYSDGWKPVCIGEFYSNEFEDKRLKQCCSCEKSFREFKNDKKECPFCSSGNWIFGCIDEEDVNEKI